ncbi:hypothetical protein [Steroidobacter sp.]|uniref:hypothetical protein n=1 Tax=Steroidobacter sp. TaxID=1978227 RepID=UPI001A3D58F1|nr:hypothetical protein [Steroidobacter sp.]MBL8265498.1 hypothetical protein [Steroidobacter sp.]
MGAFVQNNLGLVIVGAIMLVATLVLTAIGLLMRNAGLSLRPVVFIGVFFGIICVPQLLGHAALALWPKAKPALDETAIAGVGGFDRPELIFGPDVERARLQDARPIFLAALGGAEVAQLLIRYSGETIVAARFGDEEAARVGGAALWTMFAPRGTSGDGTTTFGTRTPIGDKIALQRVGRAVFMWTGPDRASIEQRMQAAHVLTTPADVRPNWMTAFDSWRVAGAAVALLVILASLWFLKGAAWASRVEATAHATAPLSAAELDMRIGALASSSVPLTRLSDGRWELLIEYKARLEAGAYRYVLELDEPNHRVKVLEYLSSRRSRAGEYSWKLQMGITFFHKDSAVDLQQGTGPLQRAVTEAGWTWQPMLFDAPRALAWLVS